MPKIFLPPPGDPYTILEKLPTAGYTCIIEPRPISTGAVKIGRGENAKKLAELKALALAARTFCAMAYVHNATAVYVHETMFAERRKLGWLGISRSVVCTQVISFYTRS